MDTAELRELLTPEALRLLDALPESDSPADAVALVTSLRRDGHSAERVAAVLTQYRLRRKARAKFGPFADRMLFTEAGLEQASRLRVAAQHAGRFVRTGQRHVADLGCGIGGDALALASLDLAVTAVERDPVTAAIASYNLAPFANASVVNADLTEVSLDDADALWLDPARRAGARKLSRPDDWSPSLDVALELSHARPAGIKLAPAMDRGLIPDSHEAQWVSDGGDVVEVVLWSGALAREGVRRAALVLGSDGSAHELTAAADSPDVETGPLGAFLYEPDGAVIRARLIGDLARSLDARPVHPTIAYLSSDRLTPTPFATVFRVRERWPLKKALIARELAARDIGTVEIKKRGVDIDPAEFRRALKPKGNASATLILTRVAAERVALLVERA
ncbi:THUMP-like domain-containing protein [Microcella sp.]|uniref:THUMP-like domain-containing protein n=1 Tax=Microcella sp. TaxID=1913979 RepID=UPI00391B0CF5